MAAGWVHATIDLMSFGRSYFDLHQSKDSPWRELGYKHRKVNHEWYNVFGKIWDFNEPFPPIVHMKTNAIENEDEAEKFQSMISHDYLDKIWDTLNKNQRRNVEQMCKWYLEHPDELNRMCGVDVNKGLIYRVVDGKEVTEHCPQ